MSRITEQDPVVDPETARCVLRALQAWSRSDRLDEEQSLEAAIAERYNTNPEQCVIDASGDVHNGRIWLHAVELPGLVTWLAEHNWTWEVETAEKNGA